MRDHGTHVPCRTRLRDCHIAVGATGFNAPQGRQRRLQRGSSDRQESPDNMFRQSYILIVESDDLIRSLLEQWLTDAGYAVRFGEAGQRRNASKPDLVIVNVARPRDAERLIGSLQTEYDAPMLIVSARFIRGLGASAELARELGVRKVLPKPFTRQELLAAVWEAIEVQQSSATNRAG